MLPNSSGALACLKHTGWWRKRIEMEKANGGRRLKSLICFLNSFARRASVRAIRSIRGKETAEATNRRCGSPPVPPRARGFLTNVAAAFRMNFKPAVLVPNQLAFDAQQRVGVVQDGRVH